MRLCLERYHGLGNDYLVYDPHKNDLPLTEAAVKLICDRNFGFGSDGILVGPGLAAGPYDVRILNPDGSEAEKSGNGVRIFAKYLKDAQYVQSKAFALNTLGGRVDVEYQNDAGTMMRVYMGEAVFDSDRIPVSGRRRQVVDECMSFGGSEYRATCVSVGNPHCVIPMDEISQEQARSIGPLVETAPQFPNRINVQLLKVLSRDSIQIEIYERGAGYTLASGSSSCAAAGAAYRLGQIDSHCTVYMPGGTLDIDILPGYKVYMTGPVFHVGTLLASDAFMEALRNPPGNPREKS